MSPRLLGLPLLLLAVGALLVAAPVAAAVVDDHPAISRYPGSVASRRDEDGFRSYTLVLGVDPEAKSDATAFRTLEVEGEVTRLAYESPSETSPHEIFTNYAEALTAGGFEILFTCVAQECGPGYAASRWGRVTGLRYIAPDMRYLVGRAMTGGREIYVVVLVAKVRHQIEIVEIAEMERGLVTARAIAEGLLVDGRVVLDGLYFDTDKATLRPESAEALTVIATFLKDHADLAVYIVGHTDRTGALAHNMDLSRDRAAAVVRALVEQFGIDADRLAPHGVGPLAPAAANAAEDGRARNRRVEMVER